MTTQDLASWLRVHSQSVRRAIRVGEWMDMPKTVIREGKRKKFRFIKEDVWEYFKKKYQ